MAAQPSAKPAPSTETILGRARAATPRGELVSMPAIGQVWVELAGEMVVDEIEAAVWKAMHDLGLPFNEINALTYDNRRVALTLAWAVRHPDPGKREERAGTQDEWCAMDLDLLSACGQTYVDTRVRLSPLASNALTKEELDTIRLGLEKKNPALLRSVGVVALCSWLLSTAGQLASSPTTPSSTGG